MPARYTRLYVHLVWSTWDRSPLITPEVEEVIYPAMLAECGKLGAGILAIGGTEDHVHLLVWIPTTVPIARLVQRVKGVSSHLLTSTAGTPFRWQPGYGAFTVSRWDVPRVVRYVGTQREHHRSGTLSRTLERSGRSKPPEAPGAKANERFAGDVARE